MVELWCPHKLQSSCLILRNGNKCLKPEVNDFVLRIVISSSGAMTSVVTCINTNKVIKGSLLICN